MPGTPPSVNSEREALVAYLVQQREGLKNAGYGLTPEQLRAKPTESFVGRRLDQARHLGGAILDCDHAEPGRAIG